MPGLTAAPLDAYVAPARAVRGWWRLPLGLVIAVGSYMAVTLAVIWMAGRAGIDVGAALSGRGGPLATLLLLAAFLGMSGGVCLALRLVHRRGCATVIAPEAASWRPAVRGFLVAAAITLAVTLPWVALEALLTPLRPNMPLTLWLAWLGPALVMVLIQTSAEEMLFRGYLLQELAARFRSPLVWMVLPSAVFGLLHLDFARFGQNAWLVVASATLVGLIAADVTARTGTLGPAIGLHFAGNVVALLTVGLDGDISGLALYVTPHGAADVDAVRPGLLVEIGVILVIYAVYLRIMRRR